MRRILTKIGILPEGELSRKAVKAHAKKFGCKWVVIVLAFYAIRDIVLYIVLPYLAVKAIIGGW